MNIRRIGVRSLAGVAAIAACTVAVVASTPASAAPVSATYPGMFPSSAGAFSLYASGGLLNLGPYPAASCQRVPSVDSQHLLKQAVGSLVSAAVLDNNCALGGEGDPNFSQSTIASVSLLGGRIRLTGIDSECSANGDHTVLGSKVATLNGRALPVGPTRIVVPGVAVVTIDQNTWSESYASSTAVRVDVAPVVVLGHVVTAGQTIIVGRCWLAENFND